MEIFFFTIKNTSNLINLNQSKWVKIVNSLINKFLPTLETLLLFKKNTPATKKKKKKHSQITKTLPTFINQKKKKPPHIEITLPTIVVGIIRYAIHIISCGKNSISYQRIISAHELYDTMCVSYEPYRIVKLYDT